MYGSLKVYNTPPKAPSWESCHAELDLNISMIIRCAVIEKITDTPSWKTNVAQLESITEEWNIQTLVLRRRYNLPVTRIMPVKWSVHKPTSALQAISKLHFQPKSVCPYGRTELLSLGKAAGQKVWRKSKTNEAISQHLFNLSAWK